MSLESSSKNLYGTPKVGGDVLSYCTRCKMELAHVIVSMIDTRPAKVLCKTCRTQHNYRKNEGAPSARSTPAARLGMTKSPRQPVAVVRTAELWEKKIAENKSGKTRPYSPKEIFIKGDVIQHPKFGMGIVEETRRHGKMLVFFRDGEKVLVHAMGAQESNADS
jgi:hypothetical protein